MVRGPEGDRFRGEWLVVALPALLSGRPRRSSASTIGIAVGDVVVQVRATRSGVEVSPHDGRDLDAVVRAEAPLVLGLAAGVLGLDTDGLDVEGDEAAVRAVFGA
jgi:hypothetical protein